MVSKHHPVRNLQRFLHTQQIFLRYGFDMLIDNQDISNLRNNLRGQPQIPEGLTQAQKIRMMMEELGPTYIKFGQIAGSQYSALPKEVSTELERLQDDATPFAPEIAEQIVREELHAAPDELFKRFNREPIAAASIAQVHRATLKDDTDVVIKLQRPNIDEMVEADIEIIDFTANILENTVGQNRGLKEIVEEFAISIRGELDFRNEGRNADRLRANMDGVYNVDVPHIHWKYVTQNVLTMDYAEGVKITNIAALREAGLDLKEIANRFTQAMSKQILLDGFFHGDPHPGNVRVHPQSGKITFIDLGMMGYLDEESRRELGNMMISLQAPDTRELVRISLRMGTTFKQVDTRSLRRSLEHILNRYMVAALSQISFADMMYEVMNTLFEHGVRLPAEMTLAIKALIQTQEIASKLNPDLQISDIANTVSDQLFWEQWKPSVVQDRLNEATAEAMRLAPIAADAVERLLREAKSGKLTIQLDTTELQTQLAALSENNKRITVGLTLAGMLVGSAIAMSVNPQEAWSFIPALGVIAFTISITVASWMVLRLLWEIWGPGSR